MPRQTRWRMPSPLSLPVVMGAVLALSACATPGTVEPSAVSARLPPPPGATVVAVRGLAPATPARRRVMAVLGVGAGAESDGAVEFLVRTRDGQLVSIMQPAGDGLGAGQPVVIMPGPRARIAPPGPGVAEVGRR